MAKNIFVFVEQRDGNIQNVGLELIGKAKQLAGDLGQSVIAVLLGDNIAEKANSLLQFGADEVVLAEHPYLAEYMTEPYTETVFQIINEYDPEIFLFGATSIGRDLAPRVSARVHTGLTADCTALEINPDNKLLMMTRPAFGGNIMATIMCENYRPQMATVRPGVMQIVEKNESASGTIHTFAAKLSEKHKNVILREVKRGSKNITDITQAKILVSIGRGIGSEEKVPCYQTLAKKLGGEVCASRACVDAGWIDHECQIGQTGKTVRPELYLACGISGAVQHVVGMEESEFIIAINKNDTAPIFDVADVGIVGDVNKIIPKLITALETELKKKNI